jgi:hypothetical protein
VKERNTHFTVRMEEESLELTIFEKIVKYINLMSQYFQMDELLDGWNETPSKSFISFSHVK